MSKKNAPIWTMENQFEKHSVKNQKRFGEFAINYFNKPEGIFIYGNRGSEKEFTVDIDIKRLNNGTPESPVYVDEIVGIQLLCPRCFSPLYVKGKSLPDGKEIIVHWDLSITSDSDGLKRPPISVDGVIGCDYYDFEINDGSKGRNNNVSMKCGWRGGIIGGQCFDHVTVAQADLANMQMLKKKEEEARLEAERLEAERLEAERLEAERLEAERLEAERLEAERLEAVKAPLEASSVEVAPLEAPEAESAPDSQEEA